MADVPVEGGDSYETSAALAARQGGEHTEVVIATDADFPDALAGGVYASARGIPLLLTDSAKLPPPTSMYLSSTRPAHVSILGGTAAIGDAVLEQARTAACITELEDCGAGSGEAGPDVGASNGVVMLTTLGGHSPEELVGTSPPTLASGSPSFAQGSLGRVLVRWHDRAGTTLVIRSSRLAHIVERQHNISLHTIIKTAQLVDPVEDPRNVDAVLYETPAQLFECDVGSGFIPIRNCRVVAEETIRVAYLNVVQGDGQAYGVQTAYCLNDSRWDNRPGSGPALGGWGQFGNRTCSPRWWDWAVRPGP